MRIVHGVGVCVVCRIIRELKRSIRNTIYMRDANKICAYVMHAYVVFRVFLSECQLDCMFKIDHNR